jgi:hypothetical protein
MSPYELVRAAKAQFPVVLLCVETSTRNRGFAIMNSATRDCLFREVCGTPATSPIASCAIGNPRFQLLVSTSQPRREPQMSFRNPVLVLVAGVLPDQAQQMALAEHESTVIPKRSCRPESLEHLEGFSGASVTRPAGAVTAASFRTVGDLTGGAVGAAFGEQLGVRVARGLE